MCYTYTPHVVILLMNAFCLVLRLRIINRLRGREPTPEPEHVYVQPVGW